MRQGGEDERGSGLADERKNAPASIDCPRRRGPKELECHHCCVPHAIPHWVPKTNDALIGHTIPQLLLCA